MRPGQQARRVLDGQPVNGGLVESCASKPRDEAPRDVAEARAPAPRHPRATSGEIAGQADAIIEAFVDEPDDRLYASCVGLVPLLGDAVEAQREAFACIPKMPRPGRAMSF